jgi:two-component system response regulator QseB
MKVLLVEDEAALRQAVTEALRQTRYAVEVAANFGQAQEKIALYRYDCVLLTFAPARQPEPLVSRP